jgi:hypothetical protein
MNKLDKIAKDRPKDLKTDKVKGGSEKELDDYLKKRRVKVEDKKS